MIREFLANDLRFQSQLPPEAAVSSLLIYLAAIPFLQNFDGLDSILAPTRSAFHFSYSA